jgi:hypothetical protein
MGINGKLQFWKKQNSGANAIIGKEPGSLVNFPGNVGDAFQPDSAGDMLIIAGYGADQGAACKLLFEIPAMLLEGSVDRAAAVHCSRDGDEELYFLVLDSTSGKVDIICEDDVPLTVVEFTRSYADVLSLIANDQKLTRPLIQ